MLVMVLMMTACSSEDELITTGDEMNVTFTATLDQYIDSRAISDGSMVDKLIFIAYDENGNEIAGLRQENVPVSGGHATVNTRVVKGHRYTFAFWAQNSNCTAYSFGDDYKSLNVDYSGHANDESRDAFYAVNTDFAVDPVTEPFERNVTLHRPFAQLNFGTTTEDLETANAYAPATGSRIIITDGVFSSLNLLNGVASNPVSVELTAGAFPSEKLTVEGEQFEYLSMNYLLVNNERSDITGITMTTIMNREGNDASYPLELETLPVQRNFRTNIVGRLITKAVDFKLVIDASFDGEYIYYGDEISWNKNVTEPAYSNGTYTINQPTELAWFQDNAPVEGSTIKLMASFNMNEFALKPLLCGARNITIDGNDNTIRGIKINAAGSAALFGNAEGLTVKNLTIENVTVTATPDGQGNAVAAALVATASGTLTIENVNVNYPVIKGTCMVGGMVGQVAAGANIVATGSQVANAIIENTDAAARQGLAGGMVGYIASGATAEQVFASCEVYNTVLKARMSEASLTSGKLIGAIQGSSDSDVVRISGTTVMVNFQGLDEAAAAQQSPYGADQLIGGNQQGHGHIYINNVEQPLNN
jgi:hypothetical protein